MGLKHGVKPESELWLRCRLNPLHVTIPGLPPSVNKLYATFRGRRIKSREGHKWEGFSLLFVRRAATELYGTFRLDELKGVPLSLDLMFYRSSWRAKSGSGLYVRPDVSNFIKSAEDGLMAALCLDDSAVVDLSATKLEDEGEERTVIKLTFLD